MEDLKVCRVCLNMTVKMFELNSFQLESYFTSVMIESKPLYSARLPKYLCYECAALVKKFYLFREKCLHTESVLCGFIDQCGQLTPSLINSIDRQNLLTQSQITHIDIQGRENESTEIEINSILIEQEIKKEDDEYLSEDDKCMSDDDKCMSDHDKCMSDDDSGENGEDVDSKSVGDEKTVEVPVEMLEIQVKTDVIEEECQPPELPETITVLPPEIPPPVKLKRQSTRTTRKKLSDKKIRKSSISDDDASCNDDKDDLEDITVVTLTMEEQLEEINKRKNSSNYLNCPYQCHLCYKGFNNNQTWKLHSSRHSPSEGNMECGVCKYRFKTRRSLQRHALNHARKYVCKLCPYKSSNVTTVKQHQGSHKGVTHKCNHCDEVFTVRTTYVNHMRVKHPSENICGFCGYSFYSKQGLKVHKNMVHKNDGKPEENKGPFCEECDVKFVSTEAYKRHLVMAVKHTRSTDSINGCRVCGAMFSDAEEVRVHHRKEHPKRQPVHYSLKSNSNRWPAKCQHCSEVLQTARAYLKHFRTAHPDENYPVQKKCVCDICGKRFTCNALLNMHKRVHTDDRPYKCTQCDKACFTPFDLRMHQQKHSDTRPFPCTVCPKAFKRKEALARHLKIHSGDNPYKCEICGIAFNKSCTRTLHVRTVHTKEPAPVRKQRNTKK